MSDSRPTVLIVDDDVPFVRGLSGMLLADGYSVVLAGDEPARGRVLRGPPDLYAVVLEPNLAGVAWYQLLHQAAHLAQSARLLVVTAFWSVALAQESESAGAEVCLRKPVSAGEVRAILRTSMRGQHACAPPQPRRPSLACMEWEYVNQVIRECRGNMSQAARLLGIHRPSLYKKLRKHPPAR